MRLASCLLALLWLMPHLPGEGLDDHQAPVDDQEIEQKSVEDLEKQAATYRIAAIRHQSTAADDAGALYHLQHARMLLADPHFFFHLLRSTRTAERGFRRYPYSRYAGDLLECEMEGFAQRGRYEDMYRALLMIWFYLPDYPRTGEAMQLALRTCETAQHFASSVNLEASEPSKVVSVAGHGSLEEIDRIFRFLALHGDRESVAPKAELGLARSELVSGSREDRLSARHSYELFLEKYPEIDLTFTALVERALSYLVGYHGDDYDQGVLVFASAIIDQAELETHGDEAKAATVQAYRKRIRLWQQDRDLRIARWYRVRGDLVIAPLITPPGLVSWLDGARYYYQAVVARDSSSRQGHIAARELSELPPAGQPR